MTTEFRKREAVAKMLEGKKSALSDMVEDEAIKKILAKQKAYKGIAKRV